MLYALAQPGVFLVLLASFLLVVTVNGVVESAVLGRGSRLGRRSRVSPDPRRHLDPFGAIAAAIAGVGWHRPAGEDRLRQRGALALLCVPAVDLLLAATFLAGYAGTGHSRSGLDALSLGSALQGDYRLDLSGTLTLLPGLVALATGLLALVPLPPLPGGRILLALAPRTPGWQRAEQLLVESNLGVVTLLVLLILPLVGRLPLLLALLDSVAQPLLDLVG